MKTKKARYTLLYAVAITVASTMFGIPGYISGTPWGYGWPGFAFSALVMLGIIAAIGLAVWLVTVIADWADRGE